jgi:hypothetical protein
MHTEIIPKMLRAIATTFANVIFSFNMKTEKAKAKSVHELNNTVTSETVV